MMARSEEELLFDAASKYRGSQPEPECGQSATLDRG